MLPHSTALDFDVRKYIYTCDVFLYSSMYSDLLLRRCRITRSLRGSFTACADLLLAMDASSFLCPSVFHLHFETAAPVQSMQPVSLDISSVVLLHVVMRLRAHFVPRSRFPGLSVRRTSRLTSECRWNQFGQLAQISLNMQ